MFTEEQFDRLARTYMDSVFRLAFNYLKSPSEADDITQNVLIKLYRTDKEFESQAHIKNWLFRVTVNECKRAFLSPWRQAGAIEDYAEELSFVSPEHSELFYSVMELPKKYRAAIYLHYYEDYSTDEIADILGIPSSTVRTQLRRGRELLKNNLLEAQQNA